MKQCFGIRLCVNKHRVNKHRVNEHRVNEHYVNKSREMKKPLA
jgi:hypothetical protein